MESVRACPCRSKRRAWARSARGSPTPPSALRATRTSAVTAWASAPTAAARHDGRAQRGAADVGVRAARRRHVPARDARAIGQLARARGARQYALKCLKPACLPARRERACKLQTAGAPDTSAEGGAGGGSAANAWSDSMHIAKEARASADGGAQGRPYIPFLKRPTPKAQTHVEPNSRSHACGTRAHARAWSDRAASGEEAPRAMGARTHTAPCSWARARTPRAARR